MRLIIQNLSALSIIQPRLRYGGYRLLSPPARRSRQDGDRHGFGYYQQIQGFGVFAGAENRRFGQFAGLDRAQPGQPAGRQPGHGRFYIHMPCSTDMGIRNIP